MRTLEAASVVLVPQAAEHAEEMFRVLSDPAIYEYEHEPPASVEWLRARFARLESRRSADGREQWLNWVIRIPGGELIGYVQATVRDDASAGIAYILSSAYWGRGLARAATAAMMDELAANYGVRVVTAVLKRVNYRSRGLLERLGFALASPELHAKYEAEPDEVLMVRATRDATSHPV